MAGLGRLNGDVEDPLGRAGECDQGHIGVGKPAVTAHFYYALPDTPYAMWIRGELAEHLHLPKDGTRVEVVGSEIIVSPGPTLDHNLIVGDIQDRLAEARGADSEFPWRCVQTTDLDLVQSATATSPTSSSSRMRSPRRCGRPAPGICCRARWASWWR